MIKETISAIQARIRGAESLNDERRRELLKLLGTLENEVDELSCTHNEQAQSIAGFAQLSAHEAIRDTPHPQLLDLSLQGLRTSVDGFEKSHPQLVQIVNAISNTLANLGI